MSAAHPTPARMTPTPASRRRQADRSAATRGQLMEAATASLIEIGYARTTAVEICRRAGVTRGALLHHFASLADLFAATLAYIYDMLLSEAPAEPETPATGADLVKLLWRHFSRPEYKAVIELWLASRNEPELAPILEPTILRIRALANPRLNPALLEWLGESEDAVSFYRLLLETMIGLALGRAVTPGDGALGHEDRVVALLSRLAGGLLDKPA